MARGRWGNRFGYLVSFTEIKCLGGLQDLLETPSGRRFQIKFLRY